jgi:hypothetical protein
MVSETTERAAQSQLEHGNIEFRLETDMENFQPMKGDFLEDLAALLKIDLEEIKIVSIRQGCVNLELEIPEGAALLERGRVDRKSIDYSK